MNDFERVRELREEYEATLDDAERRRNEYHGAIRKLYLSGTPLREIAERLGVSHQRVHEIVGKEPAVRRKKRRQALGSAGILVLTLALGALAWALIAYERPKVSDPKKEAPARCEDPCPGARYWILFTKQDGRILGFHGVFASQNIRGSGFGLGPGQAEKELTDPVEIRAIKANMDQYYVDVESGEIKRKLTRRVIAVTWGAIVLAGLIALLVWNRRVGPRPPRLASAPALPS